VTGVQTCALPIFPTLVETWWDKPELEYVDVSDMSQEPIAVLKYNKSDVFYHKTRKQAKLFFFSMTSQRQSRPSKVIQTKYTQW